MSRYEEKIYRCIAASHDHLTAEDIFLRMKSEGEALALATVYNNLNRLCEGGKIRIVSVEGQRDRYDLNTRHDHLVCTRCGGISDFRFSDLASALAEELGEPVLSYDLKVSWLCPRCRSEMQDEAK